MKKILKGRAAILLLGAISLFFACKGKVKSHEAHTEVTKYTCSMHPQVIKDAPGNCPICGMELVPLVSQRGPGKVNDSLATLVKPTDEFVLSAVKTIKPVTGMRSAQINVKGVINYNTNNLNSVSSRVSGRIERLYVKYNYQAVSKGQKLMDIYSPDLANAQQELLFLRDNNEPTLLEAAKKKLRLLGSTEQQIRNVIKSGKIDYKISVYSPYSGFISEAPRGASSAGPGSSVGGTSISSESSSSMGSMGSGTSASSPSAVPAVASNTPLEIREGQYVSVGQKLFSMVNVQQVWAEFYISPDQLIDFKRGTRISVTSVDAKTKLAHVPVSLIQPYYSEGVNYSLVRAVLPNSKKEWRVGELIQVSQDEDVKKSGTWLPRTAVLQLGTRYVSFIKEKGAFVPVYVKVKSVSGNLVDIGSSIPDKEVALNAWFLVDSESFVKVQNITEQ
ncbi:putative Co/Zn/Cd efflux system membrane fusion protein [Arcticibacter svalbardensis MN12-7]|uniref:Putative Co/Zn/Cd efflux system membrane fusion protein n=1 Tax=Arcticibacter svalbardensis MN12-7 TaxID=1150600 RepID=R9GYS3_9SPHI|nr:efflux RND transporter periplasmic adaptor subunit [Arcticibacter svalbardensis]EOR94114.1 putative Co/Zn/Cd efflux system membrane fusion protein [Arcticibacter svalbardensis MN12-7]